MNTSGVDEPPEISVASVARLVSVFVGADTSVTWIFGYCFSNALISAVRVSPYLALVVMGLADHTIEPDVAEPAADDVPLDGELVLVLVLLVLVLLLLQPATPSAPTTPTRAATCQLLSERLPRYLDLAIDAPHGSVMNGASATSRSCFPFLIVRVLWPGRRPQPALAGASAPAVSAGGSGPVRPGRP